MPGWRLKILGSAAPTASAQFKFKTFFGGLALIPARVSTCRAQCQLWWHNYMMNLACGAKRWVLLRFLWATRSTWLRLAENAVLIKYWKPRRWLTRLEKYFTKTTSIPLPLTKWFISLNLLCQHVGCTTWTHVFHVLCSVKPTSIWLIVFLYLAGKWAQYKHIL